MQDLRYTTDRGEAALTALKEAIRLDPDSLEANRTYAFILLEISDYAAAAAAFAQLIRLSPDDPQLDYLYYSMGQMLYGTDDFRGTQAAYREALRLNPAYDDARKSLAQLLYRQGDVEAAIAIDQKVNYYMGDDFRIYEQYAAAEVNYREAVPSFNTCTIPTVRCLKNKVATRKQTRFSSDRPTLSGIRPLANNRTLFLIFLGLRYRALGFAAELFCYVLIDTSSRLPFRFALS